MHQSILTILTVTWHAELFWNVDTLWSSSYVTKCWKVLEYFCKALYNISYLESRVLFMILTGSISEIFVISVFSLRHCISLTWNFFRGHRLKSSKLVQRRQTWTHIHLQHQSIVHSLSQWLDFWQIWCVCMMWFRATHWHEITPWNPNTQPTTGLLPKLLS